MDITKKQNLVLDAINRNPAAADDDSILLAEVWSSELNAKGINVNPKQLHDIIKFTSRAESLTRRRRELFQLGLIKYSPDASARRMTAYRNELNEHSNLTDEQAVRAL